MTARSTVRVYFFAKLYIALTAGKVPFAKLYIEPPVSCTETAVAGFTRFRRETLCETPDTRGVPNHMKDPTTSGFIRSLAVSMTRP